MPLRLAAPTRAEAGLTRTARDRGGSRQEEHPVLMFENWLARLRDRGFVTCPASSAVPVDLRAVTLDGTGLHFRCRGVRVALQIYRPGRAAWQTPLRDEHWAPEESLELWENRPLRGRQVPDGGRLVFTGDGADPKPDAEIVLDGAHSRGWRGHEAGLLPSAEAALIFETMITIARLVTGADLALRTPDRLPHQPRQRLGVPAHSVLLPPPALSQPVLVQAARTSILAQPLLSPAAFHSAASHPGVPAPPAGASVREHAHPALVAAAAVGDQSTGTRRAGPARFILR